MPTRKIIYCFDRKPFARQEFWIENGSWSNVRLSYLSSVFRVQMNAGGRQYDTYDQLLAATYIDGSVYPVRSLSLRTSSKPNGTIDFDSSSGLSDIVSSLFSTRAVTFFMILSVFRASTAAYVQRCRELLPLEFFFGLLTATLFFIVDTSVLALLFGGEDTSNSLRLIISTSCAELLSLYFHIFSGLSFTAISPGALWLEKELFTGPEWCSTFEKRCFHVT